MATKKTAEVAEAATAHGVDPLTGEIVDVTSLNDAGSSFDSITPYSFADLVQRLEDEGIGVVEVHGSAWTVLKDKRKLVDVPFIVQDVHFYEGKFGPACAILLTTDNDEHYVINDGSVGIARQIASMVAQYKRRTGFMFPSGLRVSEYDYEEKDFDGNVIRTTPAATYYFA